MVAKNLRVFRRALCFFACLCVSLWFPEGFFVVPNAQVWGERVGSGRGGDVVRCWFCGGFGWVRKKVEKSACLFAGFVRLYTPFSRHGVSHTASNGPETLIFGN